MEDARDGFEIRRYASYSVCSAPMTGGTASDKAAPNVDATVTAGSGEGFNTLAGYLFGNNTQERAMDMTTPVNIDVTPAGGRTMSFVMPKDIPARNAPTPRDSRIGVTDVADGELLAVREFPGFATDGEVRRQVDSLLGALERESTRPWRGQFKFDDEDYDKNMSGKGKDGEGEPFGAGEAASAFKSSKSPWRTEDPSGRSYRLMQFNPPYTLPWLRTNAVAVRVTRGVDVESTSSTEGAMETADASV